MLIELLTSDGQQHLIEEGALVPVAAPRVVVSGGCWFAWDHPIHAARDKDGRQVLVGHAYRETMPFVLPPRFILKAVG